MVKEQVSLPCVELCCRWDFKILNYQVYRKDTLWSSPQVEEHDLVPVQTNVLTLGTSLLVQLLFTAFLRSQAGTVTERYLSRLHVYGNLICRHFGSSAKARSGRNSLGV